MNKSLKLGIRHMIALVFLSFYLTSCSPQPAPATIEPTEIVFAQPTQATLPTAPKQTSPTSLPEVSGPTLLPPETPTSSPTPTVTQLPTLLPPEAPSPTPTTTPQPPTLLPPETPRPTITAVPLPTRTPGMQLATLQFPPLPATLISAQVPPPINDPQWQGGWTNIQPANAVQQSFLPDTHYLRDIEVGIAAANPGGGEDTLTLTILDQNGTALVVRSVDVPAGYDGWLRFDIPSGGIQVVPGAVLFLQLQDTGTMAFGWKYSSDTYSGGSAIFQGTLELGRDYYFRANQ